MGDNIKTYMDGDKWCAVYAPTFVNLQESPAGFGNTEMDAIFDLMPEGTYIAKGKQYRAWCEDDKGNFPDGLDAFDAQTPRAALSILYTKAVEASWEK